MKRIFGLLKTQTIKDSLVVFVGLGVTAVIGFVFTIILARSLGPKTFGIYSAISALAAIIYSLGDLGISSAIINLLPKNKFKRYFLIATGFWLQFFIILGALVLIFIITFFRSYIIPGASAQDLIIAGAISLNYLLISYAQGVFTAEKKFWSYSFSQIIDSVIKILIVFALYKSNHLNITTVLISNVISTLAALLITFGKELYRIEFDVDKNIVGHIVRFARWIAVSRIFTIFISRIDVILLNLLSGGFQAGIYSAAARVSLFFALLISSLGSVINPRFSSFDTREKVVSYIQKLLILVFGISLVMILFALLSKPIINFVYGNSYDLAINVFRYLTLAMIPFLFTLVTTPPILYTYNQPLFYAKITAMQVIGIISLDLLLIPSFASLAPVIAMGVTNILVLVISSIKLIGLINGNSLDRR